LNLFESIKTLPGIRTLVGHLARAEGWWFDVQHAVHTRADNGSAGLTLVGDRKLGFDYLPVRPPVGRRLLRALPIEDCSHYTFVDMGSGKGRMLFLAAEYSFRQIQGVEFAVELHNQAIANIHRYAGGRRRCTRIESVNLDVADYKFPADNLVVYFFNPFGHSVMETVLTRLDASIEEHPRDVIVVMLLPEFAYLVTRSRHLRSFKQTPRYHIYRTGFGARVSQLS
jgi:hypothetical protein